MNLKSAMEHLWTFVEYAKSEDPDEDPLNLNGEALDIVAEALAQRDKPLLKACRAALARLGGDGRDGTLGWFSEHPLLVQLRTAIAEADKDHLT